jgi:C-terminal processing protease CtpA/Prc
MDITGDSLGRLLVGDTTGMDGFGKKMGYRPGDIITSFNGEAIDVTNANRLIQKFYTTVKEGDQVTVVVKRQTKGKTESVTLSAIAMRIDKTRLHQLRFDEQATADQLALRKKWLNSHE